MIWGVGHSDVPPDAGYPEAYSERDEMDMQCWANRWKASLAKSKEDWCMRRASGTQKDSRLDFMVASEGIPSVGYRSAGPTAIVATDHHSFEYDEGTVPVVCSSVMHLWAHVCYIAGLCLYSLP